MKEINPLMKLSWVDRALEVSALHRKLVESNDRWTIRATAMRLNRSHGSVAEDLLVASWIKTYPKIADMNTLKDALIFIREKKRQFGVR